MNAGRTKTFGRVGLLLVLLMVLQTVAPTFPVPVSAQEPNPNGTIYLPLVVTGDEQEVLSAQAGNQPSLIFPFESGQNWYVKQGYNSGSHTGYQQYSFDLMIEGDDVYGNQTHGQRVLAPASGVLVWSLDKNNPTNAMAIRIGVTSDNRYQCVSVAHQEPDGFVFVPGSTSVNQGDKIGIASHAGAEDQPDHIHMTYFTTTDGSCQYNRMGEPFANLEGRKWSTPDNQGRTVQAWQDTVVSRGIAPGQDSTRPQLFVDAYNRNGGAANLGTSTNGAHWVDGVVVQDFSGMRDYGPVAIVHDENADQPWNSVPAYVVHGQVLIAYRANSGSVGFLGPPTSDEFVNEQGLPQSNFRGGYITWSGSSWQAYTWPGAGSDWHATYYNNPQHLRIE